MKSGILVTLVLSIALGVATGSATAIPAGFSGNQNREGRQAELGRLSPRAQIPLASYTAAQLAETLFRQQNRQITEATGFIERKSDRSKQSQWSESLPTLTVALQFPSLTAANIYLPDAPELPSGYIWPARGSITSDFGWRWGRMHNGIDVAAPIGTPILAAAAGSVIAAEWHDGGYGNLVKIQHSDGSVTIYAHNQKILVREGQAVEQGQLIAEMGSTGYSTGPHLHFEVHLPEGEAVNPITYLPPTGLTARQ